jgi:hypothetical protein
MTTSINRTLTLPPYCWANELPPQFCLHMYCWHLSGTQDHTSAYKGLHRGRMATYRQIRPQFTINPMQRNSSRHEVTHEVMYSPMSRSAERQHVPKKQTIEGPYAYYRILAMLFDGEIQVLTAAMTHRPDNGGSNHLWNVGKVLPDNTAQHPRRQSSLNLILVSLWKRTYLILVFSLRYPAVPE